jgi:cytochrome c
MLRVGCGSCHRISGVAGAQGRTGPSLKGLGERQYIAGILPNTPENLARWLLHPDQIKPGTIMPDVGMSEEEAAAVAAYSRH